MVGNITNTIPNKLQEDSQESVGKRSIRQRIRIGPLKKISSQIFHQNLDIKFLGNIPIFNGLETSYIKEILSKKVIVRTYQPGDTIYLYNTPLEFVTILNKGSLGIYYEKNAQGAADEVLTSPGQLYGDLEVFTDRVCRSTVIALDKRRSVQELKEEIESQLTDKYEVRKLMSDNIILYQLDADDFLNLTRTYTQPVVLNALSTLVSKVEGLNKYINTKNDKKALEDRFLQTRNSRDKIQSFTLSDNEYCDYAFYIHKYLTNFENRPSDHNKLYLIVNFYHVSAINNLHENTKALFKICIKNLEKLREYGLLVLFEKTYIYSVLKKKKKGSFKSHIKEVDTIHENTSLFRKYALFKYLNIVEVCKLINDDFKEKPFQPNERIVNQGEKGKELYIIKSGSLKLVSNTSNEKLITLDTKFSGDYFGERSLSHSDYQYPYSVIAEIEGSSIVITNHLFQRFLKLHTNHLFKCAKEYSNTFLELRAIKKMHEPSIDNYPCPNPNFNPIETLLTFRETENVEEVTPRNRGFAALDLNKLSPSRSTPIIKAKKSPRLFELDKSFSAPELESSAKIDPKTIEDRLYTISITYKPDQDKELLLQTLPVNQFFRSVIPGNIEPAGIIINDEVVYSGEKIENIGSEIFQDMFNKIFDVPIISQIDFFKRLIHEFFYVKNYLPNEFIDILKPILELKIFDSTMDKLVIEVLKSTLAYQYIVKQKVIDHMSQIYLECSNSILDNFFLKILKSIEERGSFTVFEYIQELLEHRIFISLLEKNEACKIIIDKATTRQKIFEFLASETSLHNHVEFTIIINHAINSAFADANFIDLKTLITNIVESIKQQQKKNKSLTNAIIQYVLKLNQINLSHLINSVYSLDNSFDNFINTFLKHSLFSNIADFNSSAGFSKRNIKELVVQFMKINPKEPKAVKLLEPLFDFIDSTHRTNHINCASDMVTHHDLIQNYKGMANDKKSALKNAFSDVFGSQPICYASFIQNFMGFILAEKVKFEHFSLIKRIVGKMDLSLNEDELNKLTKSIFVLRELENVLSLDVALKNVEMNYPMFDFRSFKTSSNDYIDASSLVRKTASFLATLSTNVCAPLEMLIMARFGHLFKNSPGSAIFVKFIKGFTLNIRFESFENYSVECTKMIGIFNSMGRDSIGPVSFNKLAAIIPFKIRTSKNGASGSPFTREANFPIKPGMLIICDENSEAHTQLFKCLEQGI